MFQWNMAMNFKEAHEAFVKFAKEDAAYFRSLPWMFLEEFEEHCEMCNIIFRKLCEDPVFNEYIEEYAKKERAHTDMCT